MTKKELIRKLNKLAKTDDHEIHHIDADKLLLEYIADNNVCKAFNKIDKWYA